MQSAQLPKQYTIGDRVPNDMVCMVNNAYIGRKQIEIPFDGKMYYGCCEGCVGRTKKEEAVRKAIDPHTGEKVDKATAYIILINDIGGVAYFASEENYKSLISLNNTSWLKLVP